MCVCVCVCVCVQLGIILKQEKYTKHIALPYYMYSLKVKREVRTQYLFFCYRDIWSDRYITLSSLVSFPFGEELSLTGNPQSSNCQSNDLPVWTFTKMIPVFWHMKKFTQKNSHSFFFLSMSLLRYP